MVAEEERDLEYSERERHRLEDELRELRSQLGKSAAVVGEYRELQQELERSERQREQLSDHIQVGRGYEHGKKLAKWSITSMPCQLVLCLAVSLFI